MAPGVSLALCWRQSQCTVSWCACGKPDDMIKQGGSSLQNDRRYGFKTGETSHLSVHDLVMPFDIVINSKNTPLTSQMEGLQSLHIRFE